MHADAVVLMNAVLGWPFTVVAGASSAPPSGGFGAKRSRRQSRTSTGANDFVTVQVRVPE